MDDVSEEKSPTNQCIKRRKRKTNKVDKKDKGKCRWCGENNWG